MLLVSPGYHTTDNSDPGQALIDRPGPYLGEKASWWELLQPWSPHHSGTTCLSQPRFLWQQRHRDPWWAAATFSLYASLKASLPTFLCVLWFTIPLVKMAAQGEPIQMWTAIVGDLMCIGREEIWAKQMSTPTPSRDIPTCLRYIRFFCCLEQQPQSSHLSWVAATTAAGCEGLEKGSTLHMEFYKTTRT